MEQILNRTKKWKYKLFFVYSLLFEKRKVQNNKNMKDDRS